jgi:hypothetical protein
MLTKLLVTSLWQNLFCMPKVFVVATANLGRARKCVRGAESSSLAAEEKLLELLKWVGEGEYDTAESRRVGGLGTALVLVNRREQSLAEANRAARVKVEQGQKRGQVYLQRERGQGRNWYNG